MLRTIPTVTTWTSPGGRAEVLSKYQLGMLHFSTQYDLLHNHLTVRAIEPGTCRPHLPHDARARTSRLQPLRQDLPPAGQKNSKQTESNADQKPVFEERYTFEIPFLGGAQRRTLLLTVLDFGKFSTPLRHRQVAVPLCEVDLVKGGHWWKR